MIDKPQPPRDTPATPPMEFSDLKKRGGGVGLYGLKAVWAGGKDAVTIGHMDGDILALIEHPSAISIVEQFEALQSIEARNAFGDALLLMVRLLPEGSVTSYEPSGFARDVDQRRRTDAPS